MLATQWSSDHAEHAEILIVKFPYAQQFIHNCLLLGSTPEFGYVAWILNHAHRVEVCTESVADRKTDIKYWMRVKRT